MVIGYRWCLQDGRKLKAKKKKIIDDCTSLGDHDGLADDSHATTSASTSLSLAITTSDVETAEKTQAKQQQPEQFATDTVTGSTHFREHL